MSSSTNVNILRGHSSPLGATIRDGGVNFSLYSKYAEGVSLLLFDDINSQAPSRVIELQPRINRTYRYWHVFVPGLQNGQHYGYRVAGPFDPQQGHRFNANKVLVDPYARGIATPETYDRQKAILPGKNDGAAFKSVVVDTTQYDWESDVPLNRRFARTIIYELHVAGFTKHPNSGLSDELRGTYLGLIEKIPYLQNLGITAVELLPVFQFDPWDAPPGRKNYWGYSPIGFFAPHTAYSSKPDALVAVNEFRDMVKALHKAGIEVILDVVYNHTCEGDGRGPTQSFRGIDNRAYYIHEPGDWGTYANYSGCGNTLNTNDSVGRRLVLDSLKYWVQEMHVDGFRFDLAAILSRDGQGKPMANPPLLWDIETDPVLAGTKLIAEAWDAGGLYQVGTFFGDHWKEWNGQFRDDVRGFFRGDPDKVSQLASRFLASPDIYGHLPSEPERSINFVTSHDGFTLNDLVSYSFKHNEDNGEQNRDGEHHNLSWNSGVEGPSDDPDVEALRSRQVRNLLVTTLVSLGVPMLTMGDEARRTQLGNNNAYCQDNEISWMDWDRVERHKDLVRFVAGLIRLRLSLNMHQDNRGLTLEDMLRTATLEWHGVNLNEPDWRPDSHSLAFELRGPSGTFMVILNAYDKPLDFDLPEIEDDLNWRQLIRTSEESPYDIASFEDAPLVKGPTYNVEGQSVAVLCTAIGAIDLEVYRRRDEDADTPRLWQTDGISGTSEPPTG